MKNDVRGKPERKYDNLKNDGLKEGSPVNLCGLTGLKLLGQARGNRVAFAMN
jgi:hypothetical protein